MAPQRAVVPAQRQQLLVRSGLDDAPLVENDQPVEPCDGLQPVCDGDHRLAVHQSEQLLLNSEFDLAVKR